MARAGSLLAPLAFAALVIAGWALLAAFGGIPDSSLPSPSAVAAALADERSLIAGAALVTLLEVVLGLALAIVAGAAFGLLVALSPAAGRAVGPWLVVSQMMPVPAIAPIVVLWAGFGVWPKVIVIALVSFFPVAVAAAAGLRQADPELLDLLKSLGAGRRRRLTIAQIPAALPQFFSGLRVAAALAVIGAVFAEWAGSSDGLGYLVLTWGNQVRTAEVFAVIAVLSVIGVGLVGLVALAGRLLTPWRERPARS
ncbi:MAG: ABC transporter permease [Baekduia sp.]